MESSKSSGEPITTIVRWRPLSPREIRNESNKWLYIDTNKDFVYYAPIDSSGSNLKTQVFDFDKVVGPAESTQSLYNEMVESVVTAALQGVNGTIFTYGQTGAGKRFTMQGVSDPSINLPGIIQLASNTIFDYIYSQWETDFSIKISWFEIYSEKLTDLSEKNYEGMNSNEIIMWGKVLENPQNSKEIMDYQDQWYCINILIYML